MPRSSHPLKTRDLGYSQRVCVAKAGKLMMQTGQLSPRARVGLAVSGGVDSLVMLAVMAIRRRIVPFPVELMLLHLNPGFDAGNHAPLAALAGQLGIPAHIEVTDFGPRAFSDENKKKSACFYCAWLRRKRLFDLCAGYGLTHLAFGHNADDLAATFFLNMFQNGRVDGLSCRESFFDGRLTVIRPLLLVEKKTIVRAAKAWELPVFANPCPMAGKSMRHEAETWVRRICDGDKKRNVSLHNALGRWQLDQDASPLSPHGRTA